MAAGSFRSAECHQLTFASFAASDGAGIMLAPDRLAGPAMRQGKLVEVLTGWTGAGKLPRGNRN